MRLTASETHTGKDTTSFRYLKGWHEPASQVLQTEHLVPEAAALNNNNFAGFQFGPTLPVIVCPIQRQVASTLIL